MTESSKLEHIYYSTKIETYAKALSLILDLQKKKNLHQSLWKAFLL